MKGQIESCVIESRLIGVIEGEQTEDEKKERNDRLIAVAEHSHTFGHKKRFPT